MLSCLDSYGMTHPGNREGHYTDRCTICERPIIDHPCRAHRRAALWDIIIRRLT